VGATQRNSDTKRAATLKGINIAAVVSPFGAAVNGAVFIRHFHQWLFKVYVPALCRFCRIIIKD
jgi:hypothetical protein